MVVGVAGMVGDDLIPTLEELLGDMVGQRRRRAGAGGARRTRPSRRSGCTARTPTRRTSASASRRTRSTHPDRYALQLLGTVLGTGMSSRLFLEVRERRGLAYYVYALNSSYTDAGTLVSQAGVDLNRADEAVSVIARRVPQARRRARAGRRAREVARAREGPLRPADREPERADALRPAPRGARGRRRRAGGAARRASTPSRPRTCSASRRT